MKIAAFLAVVAAPFLVLAQEGVEPLNGFVERPPQMGMYSCYKSGYELTGKTMQTKKDVESVEACQHFCDHTQDCTDFTWDASSSACILKSSKGEYKESRSSISGPKRCGTFHHCIQNGFGIPLGSSYKLESVAGAKSASECREKCVENDSCEFFTFFKNTCELQKQGATRALVELHDAKSGPKYCREGWCFARGVRYGKLESDILKVFEKGFLSAMDCQAECRKTKGCAKFNYIFPSKCELVKENVGNKMPVSTSIGGLAVCGTGDCKDAGYDYNLHDLKNNRVVLSSWESCQETCYLNPLCHFFTYNKGNKNCIMKKITAKKGRKRVSNAEAGPYKCY